MAWSEEVLTEWQIKNKAMLEEVNKTLLGTTQRSKIGIFCFGQIGDIMEAMSALKYKDDLWHDKDIIWFANHPNADCLKYSCVNEVRKWAWAGNGLPEGSPDYYPLLCDSNNRLNKELAANYPDTADLEDGYFPAPHMVAAEKREGVEYSNVSKQVFGVPADWEWHPYLSWSLEERTMIKDFADRFHKNRKTVMLEVFAGSGQAYFYNIETTKNIIKICREKLGLCNFVFSSHTHLGGENNCGLSNQELFGQEDGFFSAAQFTPRQVALLNDYSDLFIGISSGISVATSAWGLKPTPKLQWCGSKICSTSAISISNGNFTLVESDFKTKDVATNEFFCKLEEILTKIK